MSQSELPTGAGGGRPRIRTFDESAIRAAVDDPTALVSAERAFIALARGAARVPAPLGLDVPDPPGEIHVKGAALDGAPVFAFKVATGFYDNAARGLPTGAGLVLVFDSATGFPLALLADNGYLTDLRTAAAGALAVRHLAPQRPLVAAVLGAGVQARLQLRLMRLVRTFDEVRVWSPHERSRDLYAATMGETLGATVSAQASVADAVRGADLVVTVTPSREPLVLTGMLAPGATVLAVGSDGPDKRELSPEVVAAADKVVTDLTAQCVRLGELHHAVSGGAMAASDVWAELGQVVAGDRLGRESNETIVCDLTGVGAQDAAIAEVAWEVLGGGGT
ncbi:MAG: ornithine cyclodeaminase family protein [Gemmatimonadetes bacterium]|nr:ornithine cyclodeaminase family protein [Gemmatimonadota bacterium]